MRTVKCQVRLVSYANWQCSATVDDFIDVIMKDHRKYIKWSINPPVSITD